MKLNRLELIARLSRLRDEEAGKTVRECRTALDASRDQASLLRDYRRNLSAARFISDRADGHSDGLTLRTCAAFAEVAEQAHEQAMQAVERREKTYQEALQEWFATRHKRQRLDDKYQSARQKSEREALDKADEQSRETQAANRR